MKRTKRISWRRRRTRNTRTLKLLTRNKGNQNCKINTIRNSTQDKSPLSTALGWTAWPASAWVVDQVGRRRKKECSRRRWRTRTRAVSAPAIMLRYQLISLGRMKKEMHTTERLVDGQAEHRSRKPMASLSRGQEAQMIAWMHFNRIKTAQKTSKTPSPTKATLTKASSRAKHAKHPRLRRQGSKPSRKPTETASTPRNIKQTTWTYHPRLLNFQMTWEWCTNTWT